MTPAELLPIRSRLDARYNVGRDNVTGSDMFPKAVVDVAALLEECDRLRGELVSVESERSNYLARLANRTDELTDVRVWMSEVERQRDASLAEVTRLRESNNTKTQALNDLAETNRLLLIEVARLKVAQSTPSRGVSSAWVLSVLAGMGFVSPRSGRDAYDVMKERIEADLRERDVSPVDLEANRVAEEFMRRTAPAEVKHRLVREIDAEQHVVEQIAAALERETELWHPDVMASIVEWIRTGRWKGASDVDE